MASMILGWSEPRLTKTWDTPASHSASKKANDVVYILGLLALSVARVEDQRGCAPEEGVVVVPAMVLLTKGIVGIAGRWFLGRGRGVLFPGFIAPLSWQGRVDDETNRRAPARLIPVTAAAAAWRWCP
jgi:hypothetical protein